MTVGYIDISSGSQYWYSSSYSLPNGSHRLINYYAIKHLYYSNFNTGSGLVGPSGSFENYLESSFAVSGSRTLDNNGEGVIFSIPRQLYGLNLEPGTISLTSDSTPYWNGGTILDDGEGNLLNGTDHVGNVIYSHGQIIITASPYIFHFSHSQDPDIKFKSNFPIYTHTYSIKVSDYELNHTLNPSAQSGSTLLRYSGSTYVQPSGVYADNVTGSAFQPYITTVGLYNDSNELIAVGKLAQPLPKPGDTELTIQVKLDV